MSCDKEYTFLIVAGATVGELIKKLDSYEEELGKITSVKVLSSRSF